MTLVYLAIAFACGILTGYVLRSEGVLSCASPGLAFPFLVAAPLAAWILFRRYRVPRLVTAVILFAALGAWRYSAQPFDPCFDLGDLAHWQAEDLSLIHI